jgi:hypothetical protein
MRVTGRQGSGGIAVAREWFDVLARVVETDSGLARDVNRRGGGSMLLPVGDWRVLIVKCGVAMNIPEALKWRGSGFVGPSVEEDGAGPARGVNRWGGGSVFRPVGDWHADLEMRRGDEDPRGV